MTCCNQDCNQGDDCPARKPAPCPHCHGLGYDASGYTCTCVPAATVARVGRKYRTTFDEPPGSLPWRAYLKDLARGLMLVLAVMVISALVVSVLTGCAATAKTRTGTLPDGSEYCITIGENT